MEIKKDAQYKANGKRFYVNYKGKKYVCIIKPSEARMNTVYRVEDNKILWGNTFRDDDDFNIGQAILSECEKIYWE